MKRNLLITAIIIHIFNIVHSEENVLNSAMLKQYVFVNSPKEWFKYITKHIQIILIRRHLNLKGTYLFLKNKQLTIGDGYIKLPKQKERAMIHSTRLD